jgi:hypothetical protein
MLAYRRDATAFCSSCFLHITQKKNLTMKNKYIASIITLLCCCSSLNAQTFTPVKRVVMEDQTVCATGFGIYCPRGIVYIDSFVHGESGTMAEIISVHSSIAGTEVMVNSAYYNGCFHNTHLRVDAWPQIMYDRKVLSDPLFIFEKHDSLASIPAEADIIVKPVYNPVTRILDVTATAHFAVAASFYNLALVLTEDSVHGTTAAYAQRNIFSGGGNGEMSGGGIDYVQQPDPVPAELMYYRHVARAILPAFQGANGSLPPLLEANSTYSYTFPPYTVPAKYDASKMRAIVLLIDTASGEIRNANGANLAGAPTSSVRQISGLSPSFVIKVDPFSDENKMTITLLAASHVTIEISNILGQKLILEDLHTLSPGEYTRSIPDRNLLGGIYFITVNTDQGLLTEKFIVKK